MTNKKQLWVLTGGNGAGKTTFYEQFLAPTNMLFINADIVAKKLDPENAAAISYTAAILTAKLRAKLIQTGNSFCFETVFSHPSKIEFLANAKSSGYEIILVYTHLFTNELNQARVAQRVKQGGHDVPTDKIISRIPRTMRYVREALPIVDIAKFYDNSSHSKPFLSVAQLENGLLQKQQKPLPDWAQEMLVNYI